ncbi:MAG TPA: S9 family peptidase [Flavipsychrobacter sp.]|nr:S9 family peptidase [Flavipsychrobacter sp.]
MRYLWILLFLSATYSSTAQTKKQITLDDLWTNYTFRIKNVPGFNAMKDGKHYTQLDADNGHQYIHVYDLETGSKGKTIFDNAIQTLGGKKINIEDYIFSNDEQKLLLLTDGQHIYRRSVLYRVYVYDIKTGSIQLLDYDKVLHASFSPDGAKVAFVKDNNLYYKDLSSDQTIPVTTDGEKNKIINGNCDWVYEEEFEFTQAYSWSPDGKRIAYYRFDESLVPEYTIPMYDALYPTLYTYKYPKAGERNSIVQIKLYNVTTKQTINASIGTETDQYIPRIKWTLNPDELCIYRMNRHQNKLELLLTNVVTGASDVIYTEENKYYIEINDNLRFLPDGHSFIFNSEQKNYNRLCRWDWHRQKLTLLTKGDYDVDELIGVDTVRDMVYYTSAEVSPLQRKLYAIDWEGKDKKCLTEEKGMHGITPCDGYNFFLDRYSELNSVPVYYLRDANGKIIRTLEDNRELKQKMNEYDLGNISLTKVRGANNIKLNAWIITPPNFDSNKKYPVLMYQYSGPNSQQVADRFPVGDFFWHEMLAEKGYIIVCADGTGTGFRGEEFRKKTYLQLGKLESDDQIAVAKYLGGLPYVDKGRIGIWGWSYGGFMSATCILKGNDVFKAAISIAPVTNWRFYDNIYTERYMRTPQENEKGYDDNAPEKMASLLKGKLLLVAGTADDNVHFQNSVMLTDALIKANKQFESEYYPNKNHGIYGGNTRYHLYTRMTDFILKNL